MCRLGVGAVNIRIDNPNHALLTMRIFRTVVPDRISVIDLDRIRRHHGIGGFDGHVPREQAVVHGHTRGVEGGLDDGMVLLGKTAVRACLLQVLLEFGRVKFTFG